MTGRRKRAAIISRAVGFMGIAGIALPSILAGSVAGSVVTVVAGIVVYYAGAAAAIANLSEVGPTKNAQ